MRIDLSKSFDFVDWNVFVNMLEVRGFSHGT